MIDIYRQVYTSTFTIFVLLIGLVVAIIVRLFFLDPAMPVIGIFHTTFFSWDNEGHIMYGDLGPLLQMTLIGGAGLATMWVSSRLDFVEPDDDRFTGIVFKCATLAAVTWIIALYFVFLDNLDIPTPITQLNFVEVLRTLSTAAFHVVVRLLGLFLMLPMSLLWVVFPILCLALVIGGVLSVGRAVIFLITRHRLRGTYERGQRRATFNAPEVVNNLGAGSTSQAESRAFLKDAVSLLATARKRAKKLNEELDGLSQKVRDDAQRLEIEAELSQTLAEIEETKIKIDELKRKPGDRA